MLYFYQYGWMRKPSLRLSGGRGSADCVGDIGCAGDETAPFDPKAMSQPLPNLLFHLVIVADEETHGLPAVVLDIHAGKVVQGFGNIEAVIDGDKLHLMSVGEQPLVIIPYAQVDNGERLAVFVGDTGNISESLHGLTSLSGALVPFDETIITYFREFVNPFFEKNEKITIFFSHYLTQSATD